MPHFAILCPEGAGHLLSLGPIGNELVRRGHRVTVVAHEKAAGIAGQFGLPWYELKTDDVPYRSSPLLWLAFSLFGVGWRIGLRDVFRWRAETILRKALSALQELAIDGVIVDQTVSAAGTVAEQAGLPFVTVCSALLWNEEVGVPPPFTPWPYADTRRARWRNRRGYAGWHWYIRSELKLINRHRRNSQLRPLARIDEAFSPLAQISQLCPEFDFPRRELPPHFHYIGSLAASRRVQAEFAFPWERLDGRPLIFASLGTDPCPINVPVFRKILAACADLDAQLVLALGKWHDGHGSVREKLGPLPGNALVVDFAPQLALLDRAALLITHAGVNTVLESLCRGVPMVALPRNADQPGMGARIAFTGVGLRASFQRCTSSELRGLVGRVLAEDSFRRRARDLQIAMRAAGGAERAAAIAEQALLTRRPVLRP
ncbi:MAG: glycosyltransferase [Planctomycetota bacterium]|nr:glycosyltransferase [Planctomycetota bacterium]